jgi:KUP system potassium uptake protein
MSTPAILENGHNAKRSAVTLHGFPLAVLTFQTLGIIYSDIGTSPLYVLNGIWPASGEVPSEEDIIGGISAIIWSLTILPLIKYVIISLHFGTHEGEGGTFALFQGLFPPEDKDFDADRTLTGDSVNKATSFGNSGSLQLKETFRWPLLFWCLFGTSLTIADGIFTPAVSVTSAVAGIAVSKPSVNSDTVPISIAILVVLFLSQRFGTAKLAFLFAPVAFVWFLILMGTGIYNITFHPGIFRAFDPSRAVMLFVRTKDYDILAGVLLALTGCEAMFANLGHFNSLSIQISFSTFVYPALVLAYLGQGARLIVDKEAVFSNIFYQTIPGPTNGPLYWLVTRNMCLSSDVHSMNETGSFSSLQLWQPYVSYLFALSRL